MSTAATTAATSSLISVIVLGVGNVGRAVLHTLLQSQTIHQQRYGVEFKIVACSDSTGCVSGDSAALNRTVLQALSEWKKAGKPLRDFVANGAVAAHDLSPEQVVSQFVTPRSIVVDCSATDRTTMALVNAIESGAGVTLANKKPLAAPQHLFNRLSAPSALPRFRYESTCGAGTPFIACLQRLIASGDRVHRIQGTFSGTLGFLMTGLESGKKYSDVVREAYDLGYTEPEPRDDLGGTDVARKSLILARTLGWQIEFSDVVVEPLYPSSLAHLSVADFLAALHTLDAEFERKCAEARAENKVLRYVATVEGGKCVVGLRALAKDSPLGRLAGTDNMIEFYTDIYAAKPLVVQGSGAGGEVTAAGIVADMVELAAVLKS